jgi:DNA ligase-1
MNPKPMRGVKAGVLDNFPYMASPKIDGMRAWVKDGVVLSKTSKPIPNRQVQAMFGHLHGADGELTVGPMNSQFEGDDVFARSRGPIMSNDQEADFQFWIFDCWDKHLDADARYRRTLSHYGAKFVRQPGVNIVTQYAVRNAQNVSGLLAVFLADGFEGLMLRQMDAPYKYGQSTEKEGYLLKLKPMNDGEAVILAVVEQQENTNAATLDNQGYTKRSSAKAGKVGKGTFGAFLVRDLTSGVEFSVGNGPGLTHALRETLWAQRDTLPGCYITYTYQAIGTVGAPRLPQFKGFRPALDIAELG